LILAGIFAKVQRMKPSARSLARHLAAAAIVAALGAPASFSLDRWPGDTKAAYRFFEGAYPVPGQQEVHYTVYAPSQPAKHEAILFLHGYLKSADDWFMHQEAVARAGVIGVAIDYHEEMWDDYVLNEVAVGIEALDAWWEVSSISLCGSSFGGEVAFETVACRPDLNVEMTLLVYPSRPDVTPQEVAAVDAGVVNLVGEVDAYFGASLWISDQMARYNPDNFYQLHVYSAEDFAETGRHGFFFPHPGGLNEVGEDSFVRSWGFFAWGNQMDPPPPWRSDPIELHRENLLTFADH
jgi:pimeloyl-ACP methyl ester carboxylesterase